MPTQNKSTNKMQAAHAAPRCTATSKRTGGRCKGPAVRGWSVCRFHGAGGGHSPGKDHPSWRHGMRSREWIEAIRLPQYYIRVSRLPGQVHQDVIGFSWQGKGHAATSGFAVRKFQMVCRHIVPAQRQNLAEAARQHLCRPFRHSVSSFMRKRMNPIGRHQCRSPLQSVFQD